MSAVVEVLQRAEEGGVGTELGLVNNPVAHNQKYAPTAI